MTQPIEHFLKDYQAPNYQMDSVYLTFELAATATRVTNRMQLQQLNAEPLVLNGEHLSLVSVSVDGNLLSDSDYQLTETDLTIPSLPESCVLEVVTEINPEANTRLEGLYRTSGNYCTQCEAEGFRCMTYFMDRPDVLTLFTTKIIADKSENKVLLSNGNLIESGDLDDGKHYAVWQDPFKKPCYLFALVAGNLEVIEDTFITQDNREVALQIFVEPQNVDKCEHAMQSLIRSMKWDEERFGLVYDLDIYMIVAVDDFNMGAMENKGLNVFNSKFVLAKPDTATDVDFEGIEAVIGHEYFHNWTGNRVTCRDWFQLTLKEGLTVFRDQEFTSDMLSPAVKRIEDVKRLRSHQFSEDAGPMSHPIQPQSYIEMNNFYTMTVYEKGAEVVRLYHTLLGEAGFQKGMKLYFERHDGQAVTVQDFRNAMADANDVDLSQMHNWYVQNGTPTLKVSKSFDAETGTLRLSFSQWLQGEQSHQPFLIPVLFGLIDANGQALPIQHDAVTETEKSTLLQITGMEQTFEFSGLEAMPYVSLLRHFSAPVNLEYDASDEELSALASYDSDSFVRWESMQTLAMANLLDNVERHQQQQELVFSQSYQQAFAALLQETQLDNALKSLAMRLPEVGYLSEQFAQMDMDAILASHRFMQESIAQQFETDLLALYQSLNSDETYVYHKDDIAKRMLKNSCLAYLGNLPAQLPVIVAQYQAQNNMTDVLAALNAMNHLDCQEKTDCLADFYRRWSDDNLVMDKWFALQARTPSEKALEQVKALLEHPDFTYQTPNRVRSLIAVFGHMNPTGFHLASGEGYEFMAQQVLKVDAINPQVAARLVAVFNKWKRLAEPRGQLMKAALEMIVAHPGLSKDVYEIASKAVNA